MTFQNIPYAANTFVWKELGQEERDLPTKPLSLQDYRIWSLK